MLTNDTTIHKSPNDMDLNTYNLQFVIQQSAKHTV